MSGIDKEITMLLDSYRDINKLLLRTGRQVKPEKIMPDLLLSKLLKLGQEVEMLSSDKEEMESSLKLVSKKIEDRKEKMAIIKNELDNHMTYEELREWRKAFEISPSEEEWI